MITSYGSTRMRQVLLASFGAIALIVALGNGLGSWQTYRARTAVRRGMDNVFASIALLSQIGRDVARERQLVDAHIAENEPVGMARTAAKMAEVDRDLAGAEAAYRPYVVFPNEANVWRRVEADITALHPAIVDVLALSAQNRDVEAQARLKLLDVRFAGVSADLARLVDINRDGGLGVIARADAMQRSASLVGNVLALVAIGLVIGVGAFAFRLVGRREQQMVRYAGQLETQNRELDAFAGRVAHDLRGPLAAMSLTVTRELAAGDSAAFTIMKRSIGRMDRVIRDLLSLSTIEAQSQGARCDPARAAALVREEQASRGEAVLRVDVAAGEVHASEGLLVLALTNLVDNAIKYAREGVAPEIDVHGGVRDGWYELSVADNGLGMSPEEMGQAFTPFFRARRRAVVAGTGLGLSIVKRIVEVSGGSVSVRSELGRGTTFVLRLRLAARADVG